MIAKDEILQIQEHLKGLPAEIYEKHNETIIKIPSNNLLKLIQFLYTEKGLNFKFLSNITCIDKMTDINRFQLVYNLYNFDDKINYHSIKILPNCPLTKNQKITIEGPEINYEI